MYPSTCVLVIKNSGGYDFPTIRKHFLQVQLSHRLGQATYVEISPLYALTARASI